MDTSRSYWKKQAARLCLKVNAVAWGEYFFPRFFLFAALAAVFVYAMRRVFADISLAWLPWSLFVIGAIVLGWDAWRKRRSDFYGFREAYAFLDDHMLLNSRLSAAYEGKSPWPEEHRVSRELRWRTPSFFLWLPSGISLLIAAAFLPLPESKAVERTIWDKPPALATVEKWIETLEQIKELDEDSVSEMADTARKLLDKPHEEMYGHAALEAADALEQQMKKELMSFAQSMNQLQQALAPGILANELDQSNSLLDPEALKNALQSMENQSLQFSSEFCENAFSLSQEGDNQAGGMPGQFTPEQIQMMNSDQLKNLSELLGNVASQMERLNIEELEGLLCLGECQDGEEGLGGDGGISRGGGRTPLTLDDESPELQSNREILERNPDAKVALGEKTGEETGIHEEDTSSSGPSNSGGISNPSKGGQAAWMDQFTPAERDALRDFFK